METTAPSQPIPVSRPRTPWRVTRSENPDVYAGHEHFAIIEDAPEGQILADIEEWVPEETARIMAAASDYHSATPRAADLLTLAAEYIRENCPDETIHYDGVDCEGLCLADDCEAAAEELRAAIAKAA